jgi:putative membrane protein
MNALRLFVNGFLIGIANIIPGMSGGTLALVLGIYERLINALRNIGLATIKRLLRIFTFKKTAFSDFKDELRRIDFSFLMILGVGAVASVLLSTKLIAYLLDSQHDATYGFFCGLVLTSILIPVRMLKGFSWKELLILLIAISLIVFVEEFKKNCCG